jgi:hypothetical protein
MLYAVQGRDTSVRGTISKGCFVQGGNIQEFSVGDTSVGDTSTLHPLFSLDSTFNKIISQRIRDYGMVSLKGLNS